MSETQEAEAEAILRAIANPLEWASRPANRHREYGQWWDTTNIADDEGYTISPDVDDNYNPTGKWNAYRHIGIYKRGIATLELAKAMCNRHHLTGQWT